MMRNGRLCADATARGNSDAEGDDIKTSATNGKSGGNR